MKKIGFLIVLFGIGFVSCDSVPEELTESEHDKFMAIGDSISMHAQQVLLANVANAMKEGGPVGAVDYCNVNAIPLTDSISDIHKASIRRYSDKYRNPFNAIDKKKEKDAWNQMLTSTSAGEYEGKDFLIQEGDTVFYYKPIPIGMSTCLFCHGSKDGDIAAETLDEINLKYPNDLATGYRMGELRGLWRVSMLR